MKSWSLVTNAHNGNCGLISAISVLGLDTYDKDRNVTVQMLRNVCGDEVLKMDDEWVLLRKLLYGEEYRENKARHPWVKSAAWIEDSSPDDFRNSLAAAVRVSGNYFWADQTVFEILSKVYNATFVFVNEETSFLIHDPFVALDDTGVFGFIKEYLYTTFDALCYRPVNDRSKCLSSFPKNRTKLSEYPQILQLWDTVQNPLNHRLGPPIDLNNDLDASRYIPVTTKEAKVLEEKALSLTPERRFSEENIAAVFKEMNIVTEKRETPVLRLYPQKFNKFTTKAATSSPTPEPKKYNNLIPQPVTPAITILKPYEFVVPSASNLNGQNKFILALIEKNSTLFFRDSGGDFYIFEKTKGGEAMKWTDEAALRCLKGFPRNGLGSYLRNSKGIYCSLLDINLSGKSYRDRVASYINTFDATELKGGCASVSATKSYKKQNVNENRIFSNYQEFENIKNVFKDNDYVGMELDNIGSTKLIYV